MSKLEVTIKDLETGEIKKHFETAGIAGVAIENIEIEDLQTKDREGKIKSATVFTVGGFNSIMLMNIADALDHLKEKINDDPKVMITRMLIGKVMIEKESNNTEE